MTDNPDYIITDVDHLEGSQLYTGYLRVDMIPLLLCKDNPKLHDLQKLWEGIARDGFIDHSKLDSNLTNMNGEKLAFVYGNGRNEALYSGWQQWQLGEHDIIPEGVKYDDDFWYIPVSFGLDAKSEAQAQDILLFHNSSTMLGGDFEDGDIWRIYDKKLLAQLGQTIQNDSGDEFEPLSMDAEEVNDLLHYLSSENPNGRDSDDGLYTRKVEAPIYEPSENKPAITDLYDDSRTKQLIEDIESSDDLTPEEKAFLTISAQRHTVLNFSKIADFYAHSSEPVQKLMENSALVIIDFDRAIELGFVKLTGQIVELERGVDAYE